MKAEDITLRVVRLDPGELNQIMSTKGFTLLALAEKTGIAAVTLACLLEGKTPLTHSWALSICTALEISFVDTFGDLFEQPAHIN